MDELITMIFRPGTLVLAVAIYAATHIIRRVVETAKPDLKRKASEMDKAAMYGNKLALWWNEVVLYAMPVVLGGLSGRYLPSEFLFGELTGKDRILLACGVGWFSTMVHKAVRKALASKAGIPDKGSESDPPPSTVA
jgi:hypothetical protein